MIQKKKNSKNASLKIITKSISIRRIRGILTYKLHFKPSKYLHREQH